MRMTFEFRLTSSGIRIVLFVILVIIIAYNFHRNTHPGANLREFQKGVSLSFERLKTLPMDDPQIPVKELPELKVLQLPWGENLDPEKLLEMASGVDKVVIDNCCSVPRTGGARSRKLLKDFMDSAPNAECGCEHPKRLTPPLSETYGCSRFC